MSYSAQVAAHLPCPLALPTCIAHLPFPLASPTCIAHLHRCPIGCFRGFSTSPVSPLSQPITPISRQTTSSVKLNRLRCRLKAPTRPARANCCCACASPSRCRATPTPSAGSAPTDGQAYWFGSRCSVETFRCRRTRARRRCCMRSSRFSLSTVCCGRARSALRCRRVECANAAASVPMHGMKRTGRPRL